MNSPLEVFSKQSEKRNSPSRGKRCAEKEWVLVVDDHPELLEVTKTVLELHGFNVISASSAAVALEILKSSPEISVLFSDVVMPDMTGVQLADAALRLSPGLHVVLASGYPSTAFEAVQDCDWELPLLLKPYSISELRAALAH